MNTLQCTALNDPTNREETTPPMTIITAEEALEASSSSMLDNGWIYRCIERCMKNIKFAVDSKRLSTDGYCREYEFTEVKYFLEKKLGYLVKNAAPMTDARKKSLRISLYTDPEYITFNIFWDKNK